LPDAIEIVEEIPTTSVGTLDTKLLCTQLDLVPN